MAWIFLIKIEKIMIVSELEKLTLNLVKSSEIFQLWQYGRFA